MGVVWSVDKKETTSWLLSISAFLYRTDTGFAGFLAGKALGRDAKAMLFPAD
jgi:hypothetical protein